MENPDVITVVNLAFEAFSNLLDNFNYQYGIYKCSIKNLDIIIEEKINLVAVHSVDSKVGLDYIIPKSPSDDPDSLGRLYVKEFHEIGKLKKSLTSMCCEM
jgi:hypothetical protein